MAAGGIFTPASATTAPIDERNIINQEAWDRWLKKQGKGGYVSSIDMAHTGYGGAGKPTIQHTPSSWFGDKDPEFWDALKEQLGEAGADYDVADQPFKSLSPVSVPGARHQPVQMPSMLNITGIPTGGSYNPYLGDPAKRKRVR